MTPNNIVNMAALLGLGAIAVSDHNTVGNVKACMEVAKEVGITVIPGMEVETEEERKELVQEEPWASCRDAVRQEGKLFQQRAGLCPAQCPHLSPQGLYQLLKVLAHRRCSRL